MPSSTAVVVVSDAHLSEDTGDTTAAFHRFLEAVPDLGDHLLINGDLFEFWFTYRSVIPRAVFPTLAALTRVRQAGIRLTVTGGNHDRWGASFWRNELDAEFHCGPVELDLAGWSAWACHGDGLVELDATGRFMHRITGHSLTARAFHLLHPDLAFSLVRRLSRFLATRRRDETVVSRAAAAQAEYARRLLDDHRNLDLVVLGHTHRQALEPVADNRWYLNPGAWIDGHRFAVISPEGPTLHEFS
ncbi:UDP-2,3-diacylglucosamine diphosphatase [Gemmatimonadota bacterium]